MKPDVVKVYPDEFIGDDLRQDGNGYFYWPLEIVYQDNFWPDKPVTTKLTIQWSAIPKLIEQLQLAQQLNTLMSEIEEISLTDKVSISDDKYAVLLEKTRLVSNELKALNGGELLSPETIERRSKSVNDDNELGEDNEPE